ncbi:MAG: DUF3999 family protein [Comamonadaceae bacterium]|nr:MAG: DUF3999 family protein [Comamonadaceae bacterium]
MSKAGWNGALSLCVALAGPCLADVPKPQEFAWRAALELPASTSGARVGVPAEALLQLQSSDARDVRIFNAAGEPVAFGFAAPPAPPASAQRTARYTAFPLFSAAPGARPARGAVQVRIDGAGAPAPVWVQLGGAEGKPAASAPGATSTRLNAALFDTRQEKQPLRALELQAELPANVPVHITGATSPDLAQWRPLELRGRLYRFDGPDGMANMTLELEQPLQLEGQYLRLGWEGQDGVAVNYVGGLVAAALPVARVAAPLPPPTVAGPAALEWPLAFATPVAALALATTQPNSLVPVRILGRNDAAQPWRTLASTVVYRLQGANGSAETTNPAVPLGGASVRYLRVEATHGMQLAPSALRASVEFTPVQMVFVASGPAPFQLAAGRAGTDAAALPAAMLAGTLPLKLAELPEARIGAVQLRQTASAGPFAAFVLPGQSGRSLLLWAVLGGGVLLLGGVAWTLFRQLKAGAPPPA